MARSLSSPLTASIPALLLFVGFTSAVTWPNTRVLPAEVAMSRSRTREAESTSTRKLLQTSNTYPSNSAPPGSATPGGLLIYTPTNCSYLDGDDFAQFFTDAYNNNNTKGVYLSAGNYTVNSAFDWKPWVLLMSCTGNTGRTRQFELSFEGSTLFAGNRDRGLIGFDTCANLYVHGGYITHAQDQLPFTQGTLTFVSDNYWTLKTDAGYPGDVLLADGNGHLCVLYDSAGQLIQNGTDFYPGQFTPLGNGLYNLTTGFYLPSAQVGSRVACRGDTEGQHVVFCNYCKNLRMTGLTVYSSNIFGVFESQCTNSTYDRISIVPNPQGINGIPPLFSSNADGIHSSLPFSGPQITNSVILSPGDDSIAVQGIYLVVAQINKNAKSIVVGSWSCDDPSCLSMNVGDSLLMYSSKFQNLGSATIRTVTPTTNPGTIIGSSPNAPAFNYDTAYYFTMTFSSLPTAWGNSGGPDGFVTVPVHNGQGSNIINNTMGNNRARGIYYKGLNGQITNNTIFKPSAIGILLAPDLSFLESDFNQNVLIRGNNVTCTGTGIFVSSINNQLLATQYPGHNNITVVNNTILESYHPLIVGSATKINVTGNSVVNGGCYPSNFGDILDNQSTVPKALVYVSYTTSSTFARNTFTTTRPDCQTYGNYTSPYQRGPGVSSTTFS